MTEEKAAALLGEGTESAALDYKETLDLRRGCDVVELAKDVAAMAAEGGYLVIGADSHGQLSDRFTADAAKAFDEANLRQKLTKYVPDAASVLPGHHTIDGHPVVVVYVPPQRDGFTIFKVDGQYEEPGRDGKSRTTTVFRAGEVFVRHGTSSERWQQADIAKVLKRRDDRVREETRTELAATITAIESGRRGQQIAAGPLAAFTWQLDQETFDSTAVEVLRSQDGPSLRLFLITTVGEADRLLVTGEADALRTLLDRVVALAAVAVTLGQPDAVTRVTRALLDIYRLGFSEGGSERHGLALTAPQLWVELIGRVEGLGALAVRLEEWAMVRTLAYQRPNLGDDYFPGWIRHGQVAGSRTGVFRSANGKDRPGLLVAVARNHVHQLPALRPDRPDDSAHNTDPSAEPATADALLTSLCQFDALAGVAVMTLSGRIDDVSFYTSFAGYYAARTGPALARLVTDPDMRAQLLPGVDDDKLRAALTELIKLAQSESWQRMRPWDLHDPRLQQFLAGG